MTRPVLLDGVGFVTVALGLAAVLLGLSDTSRDGGFGHPDVLVPLLVGLALLAVFTRRTLHRRGEPLVDLRLLRHLPLASSTLLLFLSGFALYGAMLLIPLYFQQLRGLTALTAGLLLIPQGVARCSAARSPRGCRSGSARAGWSSAGSPSSPWARCPSSAPPRAPTSRSSVRSCWCGAWGSAR